MSKEFSCISGFWTGVYDYPDNYGEPVPFNTVITEVAGLLSGEIDEPNTISSASVDKLFSKISGTRANDLVTFIKTYENLPGVEHQVHYEGTVNNEFTKIAGLWTTMERDGLSWSGPFIMDRSSSGKGETRKIEQGADLFAGIKSR